MRPAGRGQIERLMPALLEAGPFAAAEDVRALCRAQPWRVGVTASGEAALTRRHSYLPLLLVERLWCDDSRVPALVEGLARVACEQGCERLVSPFVTTSEAAGYERAGMRADREIVTLQQNERPTAVAATHPVETVSFAEGREALELDAEVFEPFWRFDQEWMARSASGGRLATVHADGALAGYAICRLAAEQGHMVRLAVRDAYRRRGIARALLSDALQSLWAQGAEVVTVNTQVENDAARLLYRSMGFSESPERLYVLISDTL